MKHSPIVNIADYKAAYDALGEEFDLARALIEARAAAGLLQSQLAKKMKTSQSYIARIEGGKVRPSTDRKRVSALVSAVSRIFASWNRITVWLKGLEGLRRSV